MDETGGSEVEASSAVLGPSREQPGDDHSPEDGRGCPGSPVLQSPSQLCPLGGWLHTSSGSGSSLTRRCLSMMVPWTWRLCPRPFTSLPLGRAPGPSCVPRSSTGSAQSNCSLRTWCMSRWRYTTENYIFGALEAGSLKSRARRTISLWQL